MEKACQRCGEIAYLRPRGNRVGSYCVPCIRKYDNERHTKLTEEQQATKQSRSKKYKTEKRNFFNSYMEDKFCSDCGESDSIVLEFDHLDRSSKSGNIGNMLYRVSTKRLMDEIAKCEVVCANCHRRRTAVQFNWNK